jgi:hypothetical protein
MSLSWQFLRTVVDITFHLQSKNLKFKIQKLCVYLAFCECEAWPFGLQERHNRLLRAAVRRKEQEITERGKCIIWRFIIRTLHQISLGF